MAVKHDKTREIRKKNQVLWAPKKKLLDTFYPVVNLDLFKQGKVE